MGYIRASLLNALGTSVRVDKERRGCTASTTVLSDLSLTLFCPHGPQWSIFDKSILFLIRALQFSTFHRPIGFAASFENSRFTKSIRVFIIGSAQNVVLVKIFWNLLDEVQFLFVQQGAAPWIYLSSNPFYNLLGSLSNLALLSCRHSIPMNQITNIRCASQFGSMF